MMRHYLFSLSMHIPASAAASAWAWFVCIYACELARACVFAQDNFILEAILQFVDALAASCSKIHSLHYRSTHSEKWAFWMRAQKSRRSWFTCVSGVCSAAMGEHWAFLLCILFRCPFGLMGEQRAISLFEQTRKFQQLRQCLLFWCRWF